MKFLKIFLFIYLFFSCHSLLAENDAKSWLKKEIDIILAAYENENLPNENRFLMIEQTINNNFAGTGIAKFVAGKSWNGASQEAKIE